MTRVVLPEDASEEEILALARLKFIDKLRQESWAENIEEITEDTEVPYDPQHDKDI
jgi:hypothetical protein